MGSKIKKKQTYLDRDFDRDGDFDLLDLLRLRLRLLLLLRLRDLLQKQIFMSVKPTY